MLGCYDFCGHYEWTFAWLERAGGEALLHAYWDQAIHHDSQRHARELILREGVAGMEEYWGHTLAEESPSRGYEITIRPDVFRIDMHDCPSKGFLLRNGLAHHRDYCDHCIGWVGPLLREAGFVVHHEHNHRGQCWWEHRPAALTPEPSGIGELSGRHDVRLLPGWDSGETPIDRYLRATGPADKLPIVPSQAGPA
jgi:hypothetical protein